MPVPGSPDLSTAIPFGTGVIRRPFGGGPFLLEPRSCRVLTDAHGNLLFELELARALVERQSRATLSCTVGADDVLEEGLAVLRAIDPAAALVPAVLTDWTFQLYRTPVLADADDLTEPVPMVSSGLGTGRLYTQLSLSSGLLLERMLCDGGSLLGTAEATLTGVAPRLPVVVSFDPTVLLPAVLGQADAFGMVPYDLLVAALRGDPADLPLTLSGSLDRAEADFAQTMADRLVARYGSWVPAQDPADAPVVRLVAGDPGQVRWSLAEPALVQRRVVLPVDLLGEAQQQVADRGLSSLVTRRNLADAPSLGVTRLTVLSTLPAARAGVDVLGVEVEFPPYLPTRPQSRWATAVFEHDETVELEVRLSPDEPLRYRATPFAVIADETGTRRLDAPALLSSGPVLRLGPEAFPVELLSCAVTPELAQLAVVTGVCSYELAGQVRERQFVLDSGRFVTAVAVPRDRSWLRIDLVAVARDGSGTCPLGPYESGPVRVDLASFPTYGPQELALRCVFDDQASVRALSLLPAGLPEVDENVTTVSFTPAQPIRTQRWFSTSPFHEGVRYRPHGSTGGWLTHRPADGELVVFSSLLQPTGAAPEVAVRSTHELLPVRRPRLHVTESVLAGRETGSAASVLESAVVPVATSPEAVPTDQLVYVRTDDPTRKGYVPRYQVDLQTVSGQPRYRIAMKTTAERSTLTIFLLATTVDAVIQQAPEATELPHTVEVALEFLLTAGGGATKTLSFPEVTRSGSVVTAVLTFATLMERDDVYSALTDPARQARLVVHRLVDLLVPTAGASALILDTPIDLVALARPMLTQRWVPLPFPEWRRPQPDVDTVVSVATTSPALSANQPGPAVLLPAGTLLPATTSGLVQRGAGRALSSELVAPRLLTGVPVARTERAPVREMRRRDDDGGGGGGPDPTDPPEPKPQPQPQPQPPPPPPPPLPPPQAVLPVPQASLVGRAVEAGFTRFSLQVDNWTAFSDDFFAPSPDLPPCGLNTSSSRTWVDIVDAQTGGRIYGFCALGASSNLTQLWFAVTAGAAPPAAVQVQLTDRRTGVVQRSNPVPTTVPEPPPPPEPTWVALRQDLRQVLTPEPFTFSPTLHSYIFDGVSPGGGGNQLIRYALVRDGRYHTYLQDASRPWVVYVFPDEFAIARRPVAPFWPFVTVRVSSSADGLTTTVILDYVVAPVVDQARLVAARAALLADPSFGEQRVEFQPYLTEDVSFTTDRPTESGSSIERRPDAALLLRSALKDTLSMPLGDFLLLYDAMQGQTASLFSGHVDIGTGGGGPEVVPFLAKMSDLQGEIFGYRATLGADGLLDVQLTNRIESPVDVHALDVTLVQDGATATRGLVRSGLPKEGLLPDEVLAVRVEPETALDAAALPELAFDLRGVTVRPDSERIWAAILDTTSVAYFRIITVKVLASLFDVVPGQEERQIRAVLVEFEDNGTAELTAPTTPDPSTAFVLDTVRVDYDIDDVVLHRTVSRAYHYTVTVIRKNGQQDRDAQPTTATAETLFPAVVR